MPKTEQVRDRKPSLLERELLDFYDEFTAQNARVLFIIQALAAALPNGNGLDERAATGAVFCAQWLNDRTVELEKRLNNILSRVHGSARTGVS